MKEMKPEAVMFYDTGSGRQRDAIDVVLHSQADVFTMRRAGKALIEEIIELRKKNSSLLDSLEELSYGD